LTPADPAILAMAIILDLVLGDPRWLPHPVVMIGRLITLLESGLTRIIRNDFIAGLLLCSLTVLCTAGAAWLLLTTAAALSRLAAVVVAVALSYTCLAARSLHRESAQVAADLVRGDLTAARASLAGIVGRDTHDLAEPEIWRALVETVAENTSDGIVAPLFWLAAGGPVAGLAYKAVSTLDSMVGYKNEHYLYLGRASARMDDLLNFIPARLTALFMILAAAMTGLSPSGAARIALRDRHNHPSPNSGHPEAAAAGALGVRLGGAATYAGRPSWKEYIGDPLVPLDRQAYNGMIRLMYLTTLLAAAVFIAAAICWKGTHVTHL